MRADAPSRLFQLYEISKLLTVFDDVEAVRSVLSTMARTLPLRSAVLLLGSSEAPRTLVWKSTSVGENGLRLALSRARTAYPYLVGSVAPVLRESPTTTREIIGGQDEDRVGRRRPAEGFILLPLVIDRLPIFGALQVEGAASLDESDLAFVNSVVNQLAVAIHRHTAIEAAQAAEQAKRREAEEKRASAEQAARVQQFLSELSAALATSPEHRSTVATCARFAVPFFADLCVIDEMAEGGAILRLEVAAANESADLAEKLKRFAPKPGGQTPQAEVLDTGKPILIPDVNSSSFHAAPDEAHWGVLRALGVISLIAVPLVARGGTLGVLSFATAGSGRRYQATDLALAVEIAGRTAMALDNARLHEETRRAVELRQDVLATVSHDLRNPLSAILAVSRLLLQTPSVGDWRTGDRKKVELIMRAAERMKRMINDLLDASSIEAGRLSVDMQPTTLGPIFAEAIDILRPAADASSIDLDPQVSAEDFELLCDRARVLQVLLNLVGNAIKFTLPGGKIALSAERHATAVFVKVTDTGSGIAPERLAHVFDRFWQARETASKGTGLGLYISKGIVEAHGGSIWVESTVGSGSTFFFTLPLNIGLVSPAPPS
jgi:signal transduction histidine kinase